MTTPNSIIADLSHEIDRLQRVCNLLLEVAIRAEEFVSIWQGSDSANLIRDLRHAIDEAHHG